MLCTSLDVETDEQRREADKKVQRRLDEGVLGLKYVVVVDYESGEIIPFHVAAQRKPFQIRQPMGVVYRYNDDVTGL